MNANLLLHELLLKFLRIAEAKSLEMIVLNEYDHTAALIFKIQFLKIKKTQAYFK